MCIYIYIYIYIYIVVIIVTNINTFTAQQGIFNLIKLEEGRVFRNRVKNYFCIDGLNNSND